jgi:hypothetical protein
MNLRGSGDSDGPKTEIETVGSYCGQLGLALRDLDCDFTRHLSPGMHISRMYPMNTV